VRRRDTVGTGTDVVLEPPGYLVRGIVTLRDKGNHKAVAGFIEGDRHASDPRVRRHGATGDRSFQPTHEPFYVLNQYVRPRHIGAIDGVAGAVNAPNDHAAFRVPETRDHLGEVLAVLVAQATTGAIVTRSLEIQKKFFRGASPNEIVDRFHAPRREISEKILSPTIPAHDSVPPLGVDNTSKGTESRPLQKRPFSPAHRIAYAAAAREPLCRKGLRSPAPFLPRLEGRL
jgi:hypothetical protein